MHCRACAVLVDSLCTLNT